MCFYLWDLTFRRMRNQLEKSTDESKLYRSVTIHLYFPIVNNRCFFFGYFYCSHVEAGNNNNNNNADNASAYWWYQNHIKLRQIKCVEICWKPGTVYNIHFQLSVQGWLSNFLCKTKSLINIEPAWIHKKCLWMLDAIWLPERNDWKKKNRFIFSVMWFERQ